MMALEKTEKKKSRAKRHLPRKFLVIMDGTEEQASALRYVARRVQEIGGKIVLLAVLESKGIEQWLGVTGLMRADALASARRVLARHAKTAHALSGKQAETHVREGDKAEAILSLLEDDRKITTLVLAAGDEATSPGPLIEALAQGQTRFPIPVTIVPAGLSEDALDALT